MLKIMTDYIEADVRHCGGTQVITHFCATKHTQRSAEDKSPNKSLWKRLLHPDVLHVQEGVFCTWMLHAFIQNEAFIHSEMLSLLNKATFDFEGIIEEESTNINHCNYSKYLVALQK